jgi:hypothetical protein
MLKKVISDLLNSYEIISLFTGNIYRKYEEAKRSDIERLYHKKNKKLSYHEFCKKYTNDLFNSFESNQFGVFLVSEIWNTQTSEYVINSKSLLKDIISLNLKDSFPMDYFFIQAPNKENESEVYIYSFDADKDMVLKLSNYYYNRFLTGEESVYLPYDLKILDYNSSVLISFELDEIIDCLNLDLDGGHKKYLSAFSDVSKIFTSNINSKVLIKKEKTNWGDFL